MEMRRFYRISSAAGVAVALVAMAVQTSCFFTFDINDCSQYLSPHCFDGGSGTGDAGGDSGPPPSCIPSMNSTAVADSCGVFVSSSKGSDTSGKGTKEAPYQTLAKALGAANGLSVYACGETFTVTQTVTLSAKADLYGALDCSQSWAYDATNQTQLKADPTMTPVPLTLASGASGSAVYDFAITAADAVTAGASSVAVLANGVAASFTRVDITAGKGADGAPGTTPTTSVGPTSPTDPSIVGNDGTAACTAMSSQLGGNPVTNPLCASTGGKGGDGSVSSGSNGDLQPTASAQTALGGVGQPNMDPTNMWSCASGNGGGTTGTNGAPGMLGTGAATTDLGTIDASGTYHGVAGQPGGVGNPGQGGGGGGGAKGKTMCAGASGGSGGAGGGGGNGGTGGNPGGASIGIVSVSATLTFDTVTITTGAGGDGGDGGMGQAGGTGGSGGLGGGGSAQGLSNACPGGQGGQGGSGGQGGGGRGGHALGIAYTGTLAPSTTGASFRSGTPGHGGNMSGTTDKGADGVQADVQAF
jgi:hypothetical protein